jgi:HNH endonuclease
MARRDREAVPGAAGDRHEPSAAKPAGSAGGRQDGPSEADDRTMEVAEIGRTLLYRLQGATSRDAHRDSGRFRPGDETARFWSQVDRGGGCWLWIGHRNRDGYGQFKVTVRAGLYRTVRAHRWAWESLHGPVPEGLTLDHLCGQPACVRPAHLEPCTNAENLRRRHARRRRRSEGATP